MGNLSQLSQIGLGFGALGAVNSAVAGYGQYQAGQEQRAAYDYDAAVAVQNADEAMQTSEAKYSTLIGKQASSFARAGVDIASGSPLLVMLHTAAQGGVEQESERQAGSEQSALLKYYGKIAAFNGTIGGISTFLSGLSKTGMSTAGMLGLPSSSAVPTSLIGN
jgi:hypothetical protein